MKVKMGDVLVYKESQSALRYGTGVVVSISVEEYGILWSGRGLTKYRRAILDQKLDQILTRVDKDTGLPKERHLRLGASKVGVAFNEHYDRARVELLCTQLKSSGARKAKDVADGLAAELFTKKLALRGAAKNVLLQLAELCNTRTLGVYDEARDISKELFFGYVLQKSDFVVVETEK
ncbi:MAG TPA: hypothetical protein VLM38_07250 [Blastocatellia bacterium]|nr:hypothetical protein [Blastocatellia bacterium]